MLFSAARDSAAAETEAHTDLVPAAAAVVDLEVVDLTVVDLAVVDLAVVDLAAVEAMGSEVAVAASSTVAVETASKEVAEASREVMAEDRTFLLKCFPQGVKQHT